MQTTVTSRPDRPQWLIEHRAEVVAMANRFGVEMAGCPIEVLRIHVEQHDVAYAVWNDRDAFDGIGILAVKGQQAMRDIVAASKARALTITAFPCRSIEEAEALRLTIGEVDRRH